MVFRLICCLVLAGPRLLSAQERYGFLALLGRDTISVERITRSGSLVTSDAVERFPRVLQRHSEITLAPDRSIRKLVMTIRMPSATTAKWRERQLTVEHHPDSLQITFRNGEGTITHLALATDGALTMPWVSQMYSMTELYLAAALPRGGDSIRVRQYFPDADPADFPIFGGFVRAMPGGKAEVFRNDGLAGVGEATMDSKGRMLSYSGARTTYRMEVTRLIKLPDIEAIGARFAATERSNGVSANLSVRDTTRATVGEAKLEIDYGRPLARGRHLLGNVIPYDAVWRTGANAATQFTTSAAITLAGLELVPGTYTLWTVPSATGAVLIVNKQFKQWGTQYDETKDLGRGPLEVSRSPTEVERFAISVLAADRGRGALVFEWGPFRWSAPIVVK